ncbi:MAG: polysaccharide biosynthesis protein, partial [Spirochaetales bacterium]|nr:polysaccharide biosynthesis protein [Spirochaetales bacterium]
MLGRDPVHLDRQAISGYLRGKPVLVTGAGGSIGSELCRQVAEQRPAKLIIFDHGEFNIYAIDHELRNDFPDLEIVTVLGDVKNYDRVDWAFQKFRPQVVFHAAAYKHVPMIEINPAEGVLNNVIGSRIVADAADRCGAEAFVFVSTDKAVNPANVMGTTKRIAEIYCQNLAKRSKTRFITTRFGNVLGSTGSVVPLFEQQIHEGGPVTVTHKDITRYFMTIPEAVGLILQAGAMGEGGEIFVLDMGEPV